MPVTDEELAEYLVKNQYVEEKQLSNALETSKQEKISLYDALIGNEILTDENLGKLLADYYKIPFVKLQKISIPKETLFIIPEYTAVKYQTLVFEKKEKQIKLATSNPENTDLFELVAKKVGLPVKVYYATQKDIGEALNIYKKELQTSFDELLKVQVEAAKNSSDPSEAPIEKIVDLLVEYAYANRSSDIHIEPMEEKSLIRFRIDGVLHDVLSVPKPMHEQIVTRIKVLSKLRTDEHLSAQDGKMQTKLVAEELDIRVSIVPIVEGEKIVLRLLSSHSRQYTLTDLGMSETDLAKVRNGFERPFGMVLSTGPTGSGKTTSIYAILKILNTRDKNIATIEDPVEYEIDGVNQIQVNAKTNLTFADGLRAILRQDPNIIFVGEIRDDETADIAINSALTGHLVLSTLHTNDAATTLPRLFDMGVEPFLVASTINVVIAQRLIRKICEKCRVSYTQKPIDLKTHIPQELITKTFGDATELRLYHGKGCPVCHSTGYQGRVGIFEILEVTEGIRELINKKSSADVITKKAIEEGMKTMMEDGLEKVQQGLTTIEEVLRVTNE